MEFQVPQFIEREPKIVGPLTFRQFVFVGIAGAVTMVLYFAVPFALFLVAATLLLGSAFALAFVQMAGKSLPALMVDFLFFHMKTQTYFWKKRKPIRQAQGKPARAQKPVEYELPAQPQEQPQETSAPGQLTRESKIKNLSTKLETS